MQDRHQLIQHSQVYEAFRGFHHCEKNQTSRWKKVPFRRLMSAAPSCRTTTSSRTPSPVTSHQCSPCTPPGKRARTHTRTRARASTRARTHARARARTHARARARTHNARTQVHTNKMRARWRACAHTVRACAAAVHPSRHACTHARKHLAAMRTRARDRAGRVR